MNPPEPALAPPRTDPAWNEAHERVESYLRAHRIARPLVLGGLTRDIVAAAWRRSRGTPPPSEAPVTLALREADRAITDWFSGAFAPQAPHWRRLGVRGRLALALVDAPGRWPDVFLAPVPPPPELADAMRAAFLRAGPRPQLFKMPPQSLPLGRVARLVDLGWRAVHRWRAVRLLVQVALAVGLVVLLFFAFR